MMKVRETYSNPDYSEYTKESVRIGEQMEALGYVLTGEYYSQGEQTFHFQKEGFYICVIITDEPFTEPMAQALAKAGKSQMTGTGELFSPASLRGWRFRKLTGWDNYTRAEVDGNHPSLRKERLMRIRNETHEPLVVAMRGIEGYDDREERLEPGEESDDFVGLSDDIFEPEIITIEYPKEPVLVSEMKINGN